jgi:hypothetical protein
MTITALQASISKAAAFNSTAVDVSALAVPANVRLNVTSLTAGKVAIFQLQSSTDNFVSDIRVEKTFNIKGPVAASAPFCFQPVHEYDVPGIRIGTASAKLRIALTYIDAAATVVYESQLISA